MYCKAAPSQLITKWRMPIVLGVLSASFLVASAAAAPVAVEYRKVMVAGDPAGTPADSPADRVDANSTSSPFAGVGSIRIFSPTDGAFICTGTPITDRHVLSAGHCLDLDDNGSIDVVPSDVTFRLNYGGNQTHIIAAAALTMHPDYTGFANPSTNDDLSILTLSAPLPAEVPVYPLHRHTISAGETFTLVGYGRSGTGVSGYTTNASFNVKRSGQNNADDFRIDDEGGGLNEGFEYDFDGPSGNGQLGGPTLGNDIETTVGGGDSGGPSFIDEAGILKIAAVNTFTFRFGPPFGPQNPNAPFFGSGGGGVLVAPYASWIDGAVGPDKFWEDPIGGTFGVAGNWIGGVPAAAGDTARFDLSAAYSVAFSASPSHFSATVGNDDVSFTLAGETYALTSASGADPSLVVGEDAGDTGRLTVAGGTLAAVDAAVGKVASADGEIVLDAGGILSLSGRLDIGGNNDASGGTGSVTITAGGELTALGTIEVWPGSTLDLQGGLLSAASVELSGGTLTGTGSADVTTFTNGGTLAPGASTGTLELTNAFVQSGLGALEIEVAAAGDFDVLSILGAATLAGTLNVSFIAPFEPQSGESFPVLTYASQVGEFDQINGVGLVGDTFIVPLYGATEFELFAAVIGDGNLDGVVNSGDYTIWADNFGLHDPDFTDGDYNGDGIVGAADYTEWADHFGETEVSSSPAAQSLAEPVAPDAVPEPSTLVLLALAVACILAQRRRSSDLRVL